MRVDAKKAFTEGDKDREMKEGVGGQLRELYPIGKKESTQEWMQRKLEATKKICKENNTSYRRRIREYLGPRCAHCIICNNP